MSTLTAARRDTDAIDLEAAFVAGVRSYLAAAGDLDLVGGLSLRAATLLSDPCFDGLGSGALERLIDLGLLIRRGEMLRVAPLIWSSL
eukprot:2799870-Prymnesium_polylepis.1